MYLLDPPSSISDWLRSCLLSCEQIRHAEASCSKFSEASKFLEDFRDPEIHTQYIYTVTLNVTCKYHVQMKLLLSVVITGKIHT